MTTITVNVPELSDRSQRALDIYEANLKGLLEPAQNGKGIAIDPESGDYEVAETPFQASRRLRARHPGLRVVSLKIGSQPDYALSARYLTGLMQSQEE